jgi:hypothetical protein
VLIFRTAQVVLFDLCETTKLVWVAQAGSPVEKVQLVLKTWCIGILVYQAYIGIKRFVVERVSLAYSPVPTGLFVDQIRSRRAYIAPGVAEPWCLHRRQSLPTSNFFRLIRFFRIFSRRAGPMPRYSSFGMSPRSVRPFTKNCTARATSKSPMMRTRMRIPVSPMMPRTRLAPLRMT